MFRLAVLSLLILSSASACGYKFAGEKKGLAEGHRLVAVPVFKNKTPEVSIERFFTDALRVEIHRSGDIRVVEKDLAPVTIEGSITSVEFRSGAEVSGVGDDTEGSISPLPAEAVLATEYRIHLKSKIRIVRNSDNTPIWTGEFRGERRYSAPQIGTTSINSANALYNHSARLINIEHMAKDMMSEAFARMTENF